MYATEQFRLAIDAAPVGMIMVDHRDRIVLINAQVERLFGYPRDQVIGRPIQKLVPAWLQSAPEKAASAAEEEAPGTGGDFFGLRRDGTQVPLEIGLNPLETEDGRYVLSSVVDISERKRAERERERLLGQLRCLNADLERRVQERTSALMVTLHEREVLLQEVHHRVKNNLQVISSLINMQVRGLGEGASREALLECQTRVQAIALIHEDLYQSRDYAQVQFSEYTRHLARNVFLATGVSPETVSLDLAIEDVALAVDKAIPCGLILNELMTNALRHAFPDGRAGTLRVELTQREDGGLRLAVIDDGVGLPAGFPSQAATSLGWHLIRMLVKQLRASLEIEGTRGTQVRLTIPPEA
jgi:two-component system, sensor histidine kinase PdtaS